MQKTNNLNQLIALLFNTIGIIKEELREQNKLSPISMTGMRTLRFILEKGEPTMKEVADYLFITPPSATSLVEHDVKAELVERIFDNQDRRIIRLKITNKGKKYLHESYKNLAKAMENILSNLNNKQIKELKDILENLSSHYQR